MCCSFLNTQSAANLKHTFHRRDCIQPSGALPIEIKASNSINACHGSVDRCHDVLEVQIQHMILTLWSKKPLKINILQNHTTDGM
jgi:hypothetical protein